MVIKVIIGAFVLLFLGFFPTLYTMFYYYRKYGEFNDEVYIKTENTFNISCLVWAVVILALIFSYALVKAFGWR